MVTEDYGSSAINPGVASDDDATANSARSSTNDHGVFAIRIAPRLRVLTDCDVVMAASACAIAHLDHGSIGRKGKGGRDYQGQGFQESFQREASGRGERLRRWSQTTPPSRIRMSARWFSRTAMGATIRS